MEEKDLVKMYKTGWSTLDDLLKCLNETTPYVILRNFEYLDKDIVQSTHPDIDVLCADRKALLSVLRSISRAKDPKDEVHRTIKVNGKCVSFDLRCVGDGYYDSKWESDILENRSFYKERFYIPSLEHYFYSLLYHALIQKKEVSTDYSHRLYELSKVIGLTMDNIISLETLQTYMKRKGYYYTYPDNPRTIANFEKVDKTLIKKDLLKYLNREFLKLYRKVLNVKQLWVRK